MSPEQHPISKPYMTQERCLLPYLQLNLSGCASCTYREEGAGMQQTACSLQAPVNSKIPAAAAAAAAAAAFPHGGCATACRNRTPHMVHMC
jgi:hypothetical protein